VTDAFTVVCAESPDGPSSWRESLQNGDHARPHDELRYLRLMGREGWLHRLAVYESPSCRVVYPFHLIPLHEEALGVVARGRCISSSPYGYGGPLVLSGLPSSTDRKDFFECLDQWFASAGVVTEFIRADLRVSRLLNRDDKGFQFVMDNVVVPLAGGREHWSMYEHKVRKNVKRALSSNVVVEFGDTLRHAELFYDVYIETMERTAASEHFKMPFSAFESYLADTSEQCSVEFALAMLDGVCVSSEMLLVGSAEAYSFLGGTRSEFFALRPNDLLKHETILRLSHAGLDSYVLGGGVEPDDGIFRYKRSFAPDGEVPFSVLRLVHDAATTAALVESRRQMQRGWEPRDGYFPPFMA